MENNILQINKITKKKGARVLIDAMSFAVQKGDICGFVGPNGAGKTTMIRMMTGLLNPNQGEILITGTNVEENRKQALDNIGAIVESPIFFPYMTGKQNLINIGRLDVKDTKKLKQKVNEVLTIVGLSKRADSKVNTYSLGMKQRLGIAQALLGDPQLLILDEPSNGLDPFGMKELRELILKLNKEKGITFFISSHLIRELELICNRWVMIHEGKIVWEGTTDELSKVSDNGDLESAFIGLMRRV